MTDKNPEKIKNIFNEIAGYYDNLNNFISLGMHYFIKKSAVKQLKIKPGSLIIDLCCGTGDITKIINEINPASTVIGIDNSERMQVKAKIKNPNNLFVQADCTLLPFNDNEFDYAVISFGLRNIENRTKTIEEVYRVMKFGGKFLQLDFGKSRFDKIFDVVVKFVIQFLPVNKANYQYLLDSRKTYPPPVELIKEFEKAGFTFVKKKNYLLGIITAIILKK